MSSSCGLTEIVLEGEAANDVYALLSRAKEECASEERDHCSEVIHTVKGDFCFAFGLENIYEDTGDDYWGPAVKETVLREDVFMLCSEKIALDSIAEYQARQITLVIPMTKKESISIWKTTSTR